MAINFKSLFFIGPTVREAGRHHRGGHDIDLNGKPRRTIDTREPDVTPKTKKHGYIFLKTECGSL
jgi:hypothetical protein